MTDTLSHLDISTEARERAAERDEALEKDVQHNDESTGRTLAMTQEETVALGADTIIGFHIADDDEIEHAMALGKDFISGMLTESEDDLAHYGVLGMKWGVRNDDRGSGRPQGAASRKKAPLSSVKKMVTPTKKSNQEIEDRFYKKHQAKPMVMPIVDNASGRSIPVRYDANILNREADRQNKAVFTSKKGVPDSIAKKEMDYVNSQISEASRKLNSGEGTSPKESPSNNGRMSDQELRDAINRMQMEKTYSQLMAERNPAPAKKADSVIKKIISDSAKQAVGQILTNTAKTVGTYAIAAAISKSNPALANAMMKGVGDNAKKAAETKTDEPDATVKSVSDNAKKAADATVKSESKPSSQNSSSPKLSDAGKKKIADEMDSNPRTSSKSLLDLGPTPQSTVNTKAVEDAYSRAYGESNSSTKQILDDLAKLREK